MPLRTRTMALRLAVLLFTHTRSSFVAAYARALHHWFGMASLTLPYQLRSTRCVTLRIAWFHASAAYARRTIFTRYWQLPRATTFTYRSHATTATSRQIALADLPRTRLIFMLLHLRLRCLEHASLYRRLSVFSAINAHAFALRLRCGTCTASTASVCVSSWDRSRTPACTHSWIYSRRAAALSRSPLVTARVFSRRSRAPAAQGTAVLRLFLVRHSTLDFRWMDLDVLPAFYTAAAYANSSCARRFLRMITPVAARLNCCSTFSAAAAAVHWISLAHTVGLYTYVTLACVACHARCLPAVLPTADALPILITSSTTAPSCTPLLHYAPAAYTCLFHAYLRTCARTCYCVLPPGLPYLSPPPGTASYAAPANTASLPAFTSFPAAAALLPLVIFCAFCSGYLLLLLFFSVYQHTSLPAALAPYHACTALAPFHLAPTHSSY